jgi:hypothetical protein
MPFRQYTECYNHAPGDKPFNRSDLFSFVLGTSAPGLIVALLGFLSGSTLGAVVGFIAIAVQYASTIVAVANEWLYHRLVCLTGNRCAVGKVETLEKPSTLGDFDNDVYFDIRLMPHWHGDEYNAPNTSYLDTPPTRGPSIDPSTAVYPLNDIYLDNFQGTDLIKPIIADLPYDHVDSSETPLGNEYPNKTLSRSTLHCEAEGSFWYDMKNYAALQGVGVGAGAAGGAAAGCAIGGLFGPLGCLIGAFIGGLLGGGAAAYAGASAVFNSDPGDFNDANVGDTPITSISKDDLVVVYGTHVYDGFHEGWHEIHPLMGIMKFTDLNLKGAIQYLEWDPHFPDGREPPAGLTAVDMIMGLNSPAFAVAAKKVRDQWCAAIGEPFTPGARDNRVKAQNRWTIHPLVDGCQPANSEPSPPK